MTLAVGFAAFNTGNNLLFFGWGLLLSSIVVSGILSEATLRAVTAEPRMPGELRARAPGMLPFVLHNRRRLPAFAVELHAIFDSTAVNAAKTPARAFQLRVEPGSHGGVELAFQPARRGIVRVLSLRALTAFPFGFFEKEKRITFSSPHELTVVPGRVDVTGIVQHMLARLGESPARRAGPGDELFSLRPFRPGDDPRRIAWRRAARTGRLVVRETEAARSRDIVLSVVTRGAAPVDAEHALDVAASLAEDFLAAGHAVGLCGPGVAVPPSPGPRQRSALLLKLALLDNSAIPEPVPAGRAAVITVVARGLAPGAGHGDVVYAAEIGDGPP